MAKTIQLKANFQKVALTGTKMYVSRPVAYNTINAADLAERVHQDAGLSTAIVGAVYDSFLTILKEELFNGHSVQLSNLCTLRISARTKATDNLEDVSVDNIRRLRIVVAPSPALRQELKNVTFLVDKQYLPKPETEKPTP